MVACDLIFVTRGILIVYFIYNSNDEYFELGYEGFLWNPSYGPWTIPKTISEITSSFSSLTTSFLFE